MNARKHLQFAILMPHALTFLQDLLLAHAKQVLLVMVFVVAVAALVRFIREIFVHWCLLSPAIMQFPEK